MTWQFATLAILIASVAPASAQLSPTRAVTPTGRRLPDISPDVLKSAADAKLRHDLDAAMVQVEQLKATIAKMQQQLDSTTNTAFTASYNLDLVAKSYKMHTHIVNGMVGKGLTSTIDGDKQVFRYVTPPYNNVDGLDLRRTGGPVQP